MKQLYHIYKNNKVLRCGYTTGTCAAAAAKGAARMLVAKKKIEEISIVTPNGISLLLPLKKIILEKDFAVCAVQKDSGDDPDITNKVFVYAKVSKAELEGVLIEGGIGVGTVTKPGLEQPVGSAAINKVPRIMIEKEVLEELQFCKDIAGVKVEISIPEGVELAKKTLNPKLGIEGGISVLGTTGIVEPMSEKAWVDTIKAEIKMQLFNKISPLFFTIGNYGREFLKLENTIQCSNFIGEAIDYAVEFNVKEIVIAGHIGKLIKVAGGIMNTHSRNADSRMELLAANALLAGANTEQAKEILKCITTEEAIGVLKKYSLLKETMHLVLEKIEYYLQYRSYQKIKIGVILFSNQYGLLGITENIKNLDYFNLIKEVPLFKRKER